MGCLIRLGCLVILLLLLPVAWLTRDRWLPERFRPHETATATTAWQPLSASGEARTRAALDKLSQPTGPAFQTLSASDLAAYAVSAASRQIGGVVDSIETQVIADTIAMRGVVRTSQLPKLGAIGSMLGDREPVQIAGTVRVIHPGLAELEVRRVRVGSVPLPSGMIPEVVKQLRRGSSNNAGLDPNGLAVPIPRSVGDIRVARGKVTLYKSGQ